MVVRDDDPKRHCAACLADGAAARAGFGGGSGRVTFIPNHYGQGIGLLVAAIGFAGATIALLRTPNDMFDLPPTGRTTAA